MTQSQDPTIIAQAWLTSFATALETHDASAVSQLFLPQGWLRDVLVFSWKTRSLEGPAKIAAYLSEHLPRHKVTAVKLSENEHLRPVPFEAGPVTGVEFGYTLETDIAYVEGFAKLVPAGPNLWLALTASTVMTNIKGHEELVGVREPEQ